MLEPPVLVITKEKYKEFLELHTLLTMRAETIHHLRGWKDFDGISDYAHDVVAYEMYDCSGTGYENFPAEWLWMTIEDVTAAVEAEKVEKAAEKEAEKLKEEQFRQGQERKMYERLKTKYGEES